MCFQEHDRKSREQYAHAREMDELKEELERTMEELDHVTKKCASAEKAREADHKRSLMKQVAVSS